MKRFFLLAFCISFFNLSNSQDDKQLTNYMFDRISFNPGATGLGGYTFTSIGQFKRVVQNYRNNALINLQGDLRKINSGLGLTLYRKNIGYAYMTDFKLNYSRSINVRDIGILSPGIGVGLVRVRSNPEWITTGIPPVPLEMSDIRPGVNLGFYWKGTNYPYYFGVSSANINQPFLKELGFMQRRHNYITAGCDIAYDILPVLPDLILKPSLLIINDEVNTTFNLTLMGVMKITSGKLMHLGVSYRKDDAVSALIGFTGLKRNKNSVTSTPGDLPERWYIGYSYDIIISNINIYDRGAHEIVLRYKLFSKEK